MRTLNKIFSASPLKDIKTFFTKELCCHIASYNIQLVTTGNPVNSYLTSTVDKTYNGPVIVPFSVQILKCLLQFFSYTGSDLVTKGFYCY